GRLRAIVVCPPLPGVGNRVLSASAQREFWYQSFHQLELAEALIDGNRAAVRTYLRHFWAHWSGPRYRQPEAALDRLAELYSRPGAFTSSIGWDRAGSGTVSRSLVETPPEPRERIAGDNRGLRPPHGPL